MHSAGPDVQAEAGTQLCTLQSVQCLERETGAYIDSHSAFHGARRQIQYTEGLDVAARCHRRSNRIHYKWKKTGAKGNSRSTFLINGSLEPPGTSCALTLAKLLGVEFECLNSQPRSKK